MFEDQHNNFITSSKTKQLSITLNYKRAQIFHNGELLAFAQLCITVWSKVDGKKFDKSIFSELSINKAF